MTFALTPSPDIAVRQSVLAPSDAQMTTKDNPRRCWECGYYSFKVYAGEDDSSGKCFRDFKTASKVYWVEGLMTCPGFLVDNGAAA